MYFTQSLFVGACLSPYIKDIAAITPTRYGKSYCLSGVGILEAGLKGREVSIGGADQPKANIIMGKTMKFLQQVQRPHLLSTLQGSDKIQSVGSSISKNKLAWYDGGSIDTFGLDERLKNSNVAGKSGVGIGGDDIILDESALIGDSNYAVASRMKVENENRKFIEISNPHVTKGHFFNTMQDQSYFRIWINAQTALEEGRFTQESLDAAKKGMTSKEIRIFFDCEFPAENEYTYFKPEKYKIMPHIKEYYGACDPALGESEKSCDVGIIVLGIGDDDRLYEVESIVEIMTPEQSINRILSLPYEFTRFGVESVAFQKFFMDELDKKSRESKKYLPIEGIKQSEKKEIRIESLEPRINTGQILFKGNNRLWGQMQDYPFSDRVDGIDCLEMAFRLAVNGDWSLGW